MQASFQPTVVISRDGSKSIEVVRFDGTDRAPNRDAIGAYFACRTARRRGDARVGVLFSNTALAVRQGLDITSTGDATQDMVVMALAAMGEYLDQGKGFPVTPPGLAAQTVECFSSQIDEWRDREPASDEDVEQYIKARLLAGWTLGHENVWFGGPDLLRLHVDMRDLKRIAKLGQGELWSISAVGSADLYLAPEQQLLREQRTRAVSSSAQPVIPSPSRPFVDPARIAELREVTAKDYDLRKLVRMCEEASGCFAAGQLFAVAMLARAIIDHIPPVFGTRTFSEVANNYAGTRSFKDSMSHLDRSARKIADAYLHVQIRAQESLPNEVQVDCARDLDVLLGEVARILRGAA